ncbi:MAG: 2-isopropylmalate synthase [Leptospiraceae bacterium]|nr:2-isopropylmalate synthase [Leptospiraceae bacterium]
MNVFSNQVEILDVTLRDGEQTRGVSFSSQEKLNITKFLLRDLKTNRVEVTSARVSDGELKSVANIIKWAEKENLVGSIEILSFVDYNLSVDWMLEAGVRNMNLLTKGSLRHCTYQLKKTLKEHAQDIQKTVEYAVSKGVNASVYLEDWSNGILDSPEYVLEMIETISQFPIKRFYLADTLGILSPDEAYSNIKMLVEKFPNLHFEFHGHNDYDLGVANCLSAVKAGVKGLHVSVNGLGERAGNSPMEAVVTALHDKLKVKTSIVEQEITGISKLVEVFSRKRISENRPIVGRDVFTQTAGIHADGDKKANLYANPILPERFGRKRSYALGKLAGKASISENLQRLGIILSSEQEKRLLQRVVDMGDQGLKVSEEDLPFLVVDITGEEAESIFKIETCVVTSGKGVIPTANLLIRYKGEIYKEVGRGDGGYDAIMDALTQISEKIGFKIPELLDYEVRIPPGGKASALVETIITWANDPNSKFDSSFRTVGVDSDQIVAAIMATEKMLNLILHKIKL